MPLQLADDGMLDAEGLAFEGVTTGGEIDELAATGLSGEAGRRVACLNDQFGQKTPFILAGSPQNGLLLPKSILENHKGPGEGCGKRLTVGTDDAR